VADKGWVNVHVFEGDACEFRVPEGEAQLITFSYSLSSERGASARVAARVERPCAWQLAQQRHARQSHCCNTHACARMRSTHPCAP
jgi:hypothetical protein